MATKHYQPLPGTRELYALLNIINDKEKYGKVLEEMEDTRLRANKAVEERGLSGNIESLYRQADADRLQAKTELDDAREMAQNLVSEGEEALNQCKEEVKEQKEKFKKEVKKITEVNNAKESELTEKEKALSKKEESLSKLSLKLEQKEEYLEKLKKDVEEKRQVLSGALEGLQ